MKSKITHSIKELKKPILVIGKNFKGPYSKTPVYIDEVKAKLSSLNYPIKDLMAISIYKSGESVKKENEMVSFHGNVVLEKRAVSAPYEFLTIPSGNYLVCETLDSSSIFGMYEYGYTNANKENITLEKDYPILIATAGDDGKPIFSLYFQIEQLLAENI